MKGKKRKKIINKKNYFFYLLSIPGLLCLLLFRYMPIAGLYMVFERYTLKGGLFGSEFVGLKNFEFFFKNMDNALRATRNTLVINGFSIVIGLVVEVALAIALNEILSMKYRKLVQTITLFPHFLSWIVVGTIFRTLLETDTGLLNQIIQAFGGEPVGWYSGSQYWWPILIFANVWKGMGYGSIVYFAALTGFDPSLYEAADIDGASRMQKIMRITVPLLKPTVIIMFLLKIGGILFGGTDIIMGMTSLNPLLFETTDTIATFVYRTAIVGGQFESASAITLYQSLFGFMLVMIANTIVKKLDPEYALF